MRETLGIRAHVGKAHGGSKSSEHAVEGAGGSAASAEDEEEWADLEEVTRDEGTEEVENSIAQMERWTLRQILKHEEAREDTNQISTIFCM